MSAKSSLLLTVEPIDRAPEIRRHSLHSTEIVASVADRNNGPLAGLMSLEQRRRNEITVHRASKISYDKSFDARGSFVHFAQHGVRNFMHAPGSARKLRSEGGWYESDKAQTLHKIFQSQAFMAVSLVCLMLSLFLSDALVYYQIPSNTEQDVTLTLVLVLFVIEFAGLNASEATYPFSFLFWMDLLATISLIFDISCMLGPDAMQPERYILDNSSGYTRKNTGNSMTLIRVTRAARLSARAGRLSRVLKLLRLLPFVTGEDEQLEKKVKMARVIHKQMQDVLSTRVCFLSVLLAIILPTIRKLSRPDMDESLLAWTQMLASNAAACYKASQLEHDHGAVSDARHDLRLELQRFADFYKRLPYGPFSVCYGVEVAGDFHCQSDIVETVLHSDFDLPRRRSSIWEFRVDNMRVQYNLVEPNEIQALMSIALIIFTILAMCLAGIVMSSSISNIALYPLEQLLAIVRDGCAQIFKYTSELQEGDADMDDEDEAVYDENEQSSEFILLEKAVSKLAAIAHLSTTATVEQLDMNDMNDNDIMALNMMGNQTLGASPSRISVHRHGTGGSSIAVSVHSEEDGGIDNLRQSLIDGMGDELTWMTDSIPDEVLATVHEATFNSMDLGKETSIALTGYLVLTAEGSSSWVRANVQESQLYKFIVLVEAAYEQNAFHNYAHALDVLNSIFRFTRKIEADRFLSEISLFWLMIAAIGHDMGHIGVNNQYLIEIAHELALTYNDRSPLENMHCAKLFQVVGEPDSNVFSRLEKDLYKEMRKGIIDAILHTDVTRHNEMIKELSLLYQMNSEAFDFEVQAIEVLQSQANTQLTMNALLHTADVANPMKPWELCERIANLCIDEFFAQGDLEKEAGIPVQMLNDRDKVNRPNSQIGFIEFMITPLVEAMISIFPQIDELADHLGCNIMCWYDMWVMDFQPAPEAQEKVNARVNKVVYRCRSLMRIEGAAAPSDSSPSLYG